MREAIAVAESIAPAVLWIDEIEKGFAAAASDGAREPRLRLLPDLAVREARAGLRRGDRERRDARCRPELLRRGRFDELFFVDLPTQAERVEILAIHLRQPRARPAAVPASRSSRRRRSGSPAPSSSRW